MPRGHAERFAIGIDLGGTNGRAAVVDSAGRLRGVSKRRLPDRAPEKVADLLSEISREAIASARIAEKDVAAVGVGAAGQIHSGSGVVAMGPNLGWKQVPFAAMLTARLPWQAMLMNDLSAAAWGERCIGAGEGLPDVLLVFVGSGVGSGIIAKGQLYEGAAGVAGELGHTKAVPCGRLCGCGERGCLEAYCGGHNLSAQVTEAVAAGRATRLDTSGGRAVGAGEIEKAALAGDTLARELWDNCQGLLSTAIANFTTLLNPSRVILGGGVLSRSPELKKAVARRALELVSASAREGVQMVDARLGDDAGVIGAGLWALSAAHPERSPS